MFRLAGRKWQAFCSAPLFVVVAAISCAWAQNVPIEIIETPFDPNEIVSPEPAQSDVPFTVESEAHPPASKNAIDASRLDNAGRPEARASAAAQFPYSISGVVEDNGGLTLLFTKQGASFLARVGGILEDSYRIDHIDAQQVIITNLQSGNAMSIPFTSIIASAMPSIPFKAPALAGRNTPAAPVMSGAKRAGVTGAPSAQLQWEGPVEAWLGAEFAVALKLTSKLPVSAWPMQVSFDPAMMEVVAVRPGAAVSNAQARHFSYTLAPNGIISITASNPVTAPLADAPVVEVTFRPQEGGTVEVSVSALRLQDAAGRALEYGTIAPIKIPVVQ